MFVSRRHPDQRDEGFTLIELMVVILIIAILIGAAIPTFIGLRNRAHDSVALQDLRNTLSAAKAAAVTNEGNYDEVDADLLAEIEPALTFHEVDVNPDVEAGLGFGVMAASAEDTIRAVVQSHDVYVFVGRPPLADGIGSPQVFFAVRKSKSGRYFCVVDDNTQGTTYGQVTKEGEQKAFPFLVTGDCESTGASSSSPTTTTPDDGFTFDITADPLPPNSTEVSWQAPGPAFGTVHYYILDMDPDPTGGLLPIQLGPETTSFEVSGLQANVEYTAIVTAYNEANDSVVGEDTVIIPAGDGSGDGSGGTGEEDDDEPGSGDGPIEAGRPGAYKPRGCAVDGTLSGNPLVELENPTVHNFLPGNYSYKQQIHNPADFAAAGDCLYHTNDGGGAPIKKAVVVWDIHDFNSPPELMGGAYGHQQYVDLVEVEGDRTYTAYHKRLNVYQRGEGPTDFVRLGGWNELEDLSHLLTQPKDMEVRDGVVYIADIDGLEIWGQDPDTGDMVFVGGVQGPVEDVVPDNDFCLSGLSSIDDCLDRLDVAGDYVYVIQNPCLGVYDVSDLSAPELVGKLCELEGAYDVEVAGGYAYVSSFTHSYSTGSSSGIYVVDVSDPANPGLVTTITDELIERPRDLEIAGNTLYVASPGHLVTTELDTVVVIDISNAPEWEIRASVTHESLKGVDHLAVDDWFVYALSSKNVVVIGEAD